MHGSKLYFRTFSLGSHPNSQAITHAAPAQASWTANAEAVAALVIQLLAEQGLQSEVAHRYPSSPQIPRRSLHGSGPFVATGDYRQTLRVIRTPGSTYMPTPTAECQTTGAGHMAVVLERRRLSRLNRATKASEVALAHFGDVTAMTDSLEVIRVNDEPAPDYGRFGWALVKEFSLIDYVGRTIALDWAVGSL